MPKMPRIVLAASLMAALAIAACGSPASSPVGQVPPSGIPSAAPSPTASAAGSPSPSVEPTATPSETPTATPQPTAKPTPKPSPVVATKNEKYLIAGARRDVSGCVPVRSDLPPRAIAGVECRATAPAVARVGFYLFKTEKDTVNAYVARMRAEGINIDSGGGPCIDGEGDNAYVPWEGPGIAPWRNGCFVNDSGYANFRATLPGSHVYIGILGRSADMAALADFAWKGNQDVPGAPTIWSAPN
jgi:hypothetical protein